jgi:hypothetical protein
MADDTDRVRHLHCIHLSGSMELVWNLPAASIAGRDAGGGFSDVSANSYHYRLTASGRTNQDINAISENPHSPSSLFLQ